MDIRTHREWVILGRFRCENKFHCVDGGILGSKFISIDEARKRLLELKNQESRNRISRSREYVRLGDGITATVDYHSDYDIVDWKIRERQVTEWYDISDDRYI